MKEVRKPGATHSFRLTRPAADLVDQIRHPRKMGGKSRKVSDAIEWYFSPRGDHPSYEQLLQSIAFLQNQVTEMGNKAQNAAQTPPWWRRIFFKD